MPKILHRNLRSEQSGFVAIIVTIIIAAILTSITISFVKMMLREQRQALDRQLSSQAFYAAESGTNYAIKANLADQNTCVPGTALDSANAIMYTCLLINTSPRELIFDNITSNNPTVFNINNSVDSLTFAWQNTVGASSGRPDSDSLKFFPVSTWGDNAGVLEVVIYPLMSPSITRDNLRDNARTFYLYPTTGSGATSVAYSDDGKVVEGNCATGNSPKMCGPVTVTGVPTASVSGYVIRLRSIYNSLSVQINGQLAGSAVVLSGAQKIIDATGKASDVLRRIQVRQPLRSSLVLPTFAIETADDLCKLLDTGPSGSVDNCNN